jgi:tellurium resistance protein TerD
MHATIQLETGANVSLTAINPLLNDITVGFGWSVIESNSPLTELVPAAILCGANGRALGDESIAFFNQLATPDGSTTYVIGGDEEQLDINLAAVPENVEKIVFVVFADPDVRKPGTFASVRNAYIRVADRDNNELVRFNLTRADTAVTAMNFAELYRYKGQWKFRALGDGYTDGITGVASSFRFTI